MKFTLTFKTPDVFDQIDEEYPDQAIRDQCYRYAKNWLEWKECVDIEFDTVAETATVLKRAER